MLYRFLKGCVKGVCRVKNIQIAWYDMERGGDCFDESRKDISTPLENILAFVETEEDKNNSDRSRVFVNMDNGDCYELIMRKVKSNCTNFNDQ